MLFKFFARIMWGSEEEWYKRKQLREISRSLRSLHADWVDSGGKRVEPGLASTLFKLARLLQSLEKQYPNLHKAGPETVITSWFDQESLEKLEQLSYDTIVQQIEGFGGVTESIEYLEGIYRDISALLAGEGFSGFTEGYAHLVFLRELVRFDYKGLIGQFDPSFSLTNPRYVSSFSPVGGDQIKEELLDFYYLWAGFAVSIALERNLQSTLCSGSQSSDSQEGGDADGGDGDERDGTGILDHLRELSEQHLPAQDLLLLIRLISEDPDFEPGICLVEENPLEDFRKRVQNRFETTRTRIEREILAKRIRKDVELLFGRADALQEPEGYNGEINRLLYEKGFQGCIHLMPLSVILTWMQRFYPGLFMEILNTLIRDGFFPDPDWSKKLSAIVGGFEDLQREIEKVQHVAGRTAVGDRTMGTAELVGYCKAPFLSQEDRHHIEQYLTSVNRQAARAVDQAGKALGLLSTFWETLMQDAKQKEPRIVSNIRTMYDSSHRKVYDLLPEAGENLKQLIRIMKNYTVVGEIYG